MTADPRIHERLHEAADAHTLDLEAALAGVGTTATRRQHRRRAAAMLLVAAIVGAMVYAGWRVSFERSSTPAGIPSASLPPADSVGPCIDRTEALHHLDAAAAFRDIAGFDMANNNPPPAAVHLREVYDHVVAAGVVAASDAEASNQLNAAADTLKQAIREMKHDRLASGKKLARLADRQMASARQRINGDAQCSP